jgi:membrane-bound ClpP family serine protease
MKGLSRRQRRELATLGQQLADQDPALAEQLSRPAMTSGQWAARAGSVMLLVGVLLLALGILVGASGMGAIGAALLLACWMPSRLAAPTGK